MDGLLDRVSARAVAGYTPSADCELSFDPLAPTIFHQPWWLDATGGDHAEAVVMQSGRKIASFPYTRIPLRRRQTLCGMPALTPALGPALQEGSGAACNRALRHAQITRELLAQLPPCTGFRQVLHRGTRDALVYQEGGYQAAVQFTFEVAPAPAAILWGRMGEAMRLSVARAGRRYRVAGTHDTGVLAAMATKERGTDAATLSRVAAAAIGHAQGHIATACDAGGKVGAALFTVWDARSAYFVASTGLRNLADDALCLLFWEAMQHAASRDLIFDFADFATPARASLLTGFGGDIRPRYVIGKANLAHKVVNWLGRV